MTLTLNNFQLQVLIVGPIYVVDIYLNAVGDRNIYYLLVFLFLILISIDLLLQSPPGHLLIVVC